MTLGAPKVVRPGAAVVVASFGGRGLPGKDGTPGIKGDTGPAPFGPPQAWQSGVTYLAAPPAAFVTPPAGDVNAGGSFVCVVNHTSGVFATDFANGLWYAVATRGTKGNAGQAGATWYAGAGVPAGTVGVDGDFFFRTDTSDVYNHVSGSWAQIANIRGQTGNTILWGNGPPANSLGNDGDGYIDRSAVRLYGPKAAGAWPGTSVSLVGSGNGTSNPSGTFVVGHFLVAQTTDGQVYQDGGPIGTAAARNVGTATGTVAAGDDARITGALQAGNNLSDLLSASTALTNLGLSPNTALDLASARRDMRAMALRVADLSGGPLGFNNGGYDPFDTQADINTGARAGQVFDAANHYFTPSIASYTTISTVAQAISGGDFSGSPASNAFDASASTVWNSSQTGTGVNGVAWIGQDFGAPVSVRQVACTGPSSSSTSQPGTSVLQYADALAGPWTTVAGAGSIGFSGSAQLAPNVGKHRYWRLLASQTYSGIASWGVTNLVMSAAVFASETLISTPFASTITSPSAAMFGIQVDASSEAFAVNTDLKGFVSRDGGTTFAQANLALSDTLSDGTTLFVDEAVALGGLPAGSSIVWKAATTGKLVVLSGIVLKWRQ